jgi:hypothetical protein
MNLPTCADPDCPNKARVAELEAELHQWRQGDPTDDLIHANRDALLDVFQEGVRRAGKALANGDADLAQRILQAANGFHPMHAESFSWPS